MPHHPNITNIEYRRNSGAHEHRSPEPHRPRVREGATG